MPTYSERPQAGEFAPFYAPYVERVPAGDIGDILESQLHHTVARLRAVPEERGTLRYEPGKWSVNDVVGHVSDTERIYAYRALRVARGAQTPLPGFEQNDYVAVAGADGRDLGDIVSEFETVRRASLALLRSFDPEVWLRTGTANGYPVSVRALAYIMAGHVSHHLGVLEERYGIR